MSEEPADVTMEKSKSAIKIEDSDDEGQENLEHVKQESVSDDEAQEIEPVEKPVDREPEPATTQDAREEPANDDDELSDLEEEEHAPPMRRSRHDGSEEPEVAEELDEATRKRREIERRMDDALKTNKRKKRLGEDDLEQMQDEKIAQLREKMHNAAVADAECIRNGTSATHKLKLLPEVRSILQRHSLADSILDNNLLEVMRMWLEPLPDASLPAFEIQKALFQACDRLPIKSIHLRESGLGKVVIFYQRSKRPLPEIKRLADKLVGDWMRPIMGRSDNYRDKFIATADYNPDHAAAATSSNAVNVSMQSGNSAAELAAARRNRAHIPTAGAATYAVAPRSVVIAGGNRRGAGQDERFKSLRQKLAKKNVRGGGSTKKGVSLD